MSAKLRSDHREPAPRRFGGSAELRDYYIAPSRDFTQYTKDYEEKYWNKETAFDWQQSVPENLKAHLESLSPEHFSSVARLALPMVHRTLERHIELIRQHGLPSDDDGLRAIAESTPFDTGTIYDALAIQAPLVHFQLPVSQLQDQLTILKWQGLELHELHRLGLFPSDTGLRRHETEAERQHVTTQLSSVVDRTDHVQRALKQAKARCEGERDRLMATIREQLDALEPQVLADLVEARELVQTGLPSGTWPRDSEILCRLQDLVLKRQLRGLKDIANHALVVEQSAIAPLSMGVIHYKRHREIQEAMTTFVNDEAKHAAVFRRFMAEKLDAKERIPEATIKAGRRYLWVARFMPSAGVFFAVIVEAIGAAFLGFFGDEKHMPDPLFRNICKTIAERDEKRHQELCAATYNELYRNGGRWERFRNNVALKVLLHTAYGDKTEDNQLIQACRAFGFDSVILYQSVATHLSQQLATIGMYLPPEQFLEVLAKGSPRRASV